MMIKVAQGLRDVATGLIGLATLIEIGNEIYEKVGKKNEQSETVDGRSE